MKPCPKTGLGLSEVLRQWVWGDPLGVRASCGFRSGRKSPRPQKSSDFPPRPRFARFRAGFPRAVCVPRARGLHPASHMGLLLDCG